MSIFHGWVKIDVMSGFSVIKSYVYFPWFEDVPDIITTFPPSLGVMDKNRRYVRLFCNKELCLFFK